MKVKELIKHLEKLPPEAFVSIEDMGDGYEYGDRLPIDSIYATLDGACIGINQGINFEDDLKSIHDVPAYFRLSKTGSDSTEPKDDKF